MSEPKTKEERLQEKLREVDGRLTMVKQLIGSTTEGVKDKIERSEKRMKDAKGEAKFVKIGSTMIEATDRLETLLVLEESWIDLYNLQGNDPVKEAETLLERKIKIIKELLQL